MFQTVRYVWVKRFLISILSCFFLPCLEQLLLWKYFMSHYKAVNINHPWLFKLGEWNNTHSVYPFLKFISGCRFTLKEYAKNVWGTRLRALKKLLRLYSMLMDMCLPIFDFWYLLNTVTPNCFKSNANSWCPDFFKILSHVRSEIHFVQRKIVSTVQSVWALKKFILRLAFRSLFIKLVFKLISCHYWLSLAQKQLEVKTNRNSCRS